MDALAIDLTVNGTRRRFAVAPNLVLADLLRDTCRLAGCKIGCDQAACGACTVLVDGSPVAACATFVFAVDGSTITTIEGLGTHEALHPVQEAFLDARAFQCGFCTSGMILSVTALLGRTSAARPRDDPRLARRQHLPVHRLCGDSRRRRSCSGSSSGPSGDKGFNPRW